MPVITANGIEIYYEREGSGPPLLFISGTGGDLRVKPNVFDGPLAKSFDLAGESYQHSFDLEAISKAIKDHLDDYESKGHRGEAFSFAEKKYQIGPAHLAVVIFVHDDKTKHVLQAGYVDLGSETTHPTLEANNVR